MPSVHDAAVQLVVRAAAAPGSRVVSVTTVETGAPRLVAEWHVGGAWAAEEHAIQIVRSPGRDRAAVRIGPVLHDLDLTTGTHDAVRVPVDAAGPDEGVVVWLESGPTICGATGDDVTRLPLGPGVRLVVEGPLVEDEGFSGGDTTWSVRVALPAGATVGDLERAIEHLDREERARTRRPVRVAVSVTCGAMTSVLVNEHTTLLHGVPAVHWPVSVGWSGSAVVRRSTERRTELPAEDAGTHREMLEPWLVRDDGTVDTIPVRTGVAPLCELPDGRWLLPGADALFHDSGTEPMYTLAPDGTIEPWLPTGNAVTTEACWARWCRTSSRPLRPGPRTTGPGHRRPHGSPTTTERWTSC